MNVFISWSGPRSKQVAETLSRWLQMVIQAVEPWISTDIAKGARWSAEIAEQLEQSRVGIICLTRDNLTAPWILFEAGALSKAKNAHVCTFLLDVQPADVEPPLSQFQHTTKDKADVFELLRTINKGVADAGERALNEGALDGVFQRFWPELGEQLDKITAQAADTQPTRRPDRALIEEILEIVRNQDRRQKEEDRRSHASLLADLLLKAAESHKPQGTQSPSSDIPSLIEQLVAKDPGAATAATTTNLGNLGAYMKVRPAEGKDTKKE